ncbi:MAG: 4-hydroxy-tetrahydrodipicolinate synthase [Clostridia bacterium]|nr:4-hydroxy-tetrahydrodipicolinate synthase [Clostridia bacterium]
MRKIIFKGAGSALITPMNSEGIDYPALSALIEAQIEGGIDAIIIGGTTGEAATLTERERAELFCFCADKIGGRVKFMLGVGSNDTTDVLKRVELANSLEPDGILVVTPYYNKGTRDGIIEHYRRIADKSSSPIMLYNVPQRTGVCLSLGDLEILSKEENIVAIKEAGDSADRYTHIASLFPKIALYAGCDSQIYSILALGGLGVVSVVSNLFPRRVSELCKAFFAGETKRAREEQLSLLPFIDAMFSECNPAPIKYAMSLSSLCENRLRLPLSPVCEATKREIEKAIAKVEFGL